MTENTIEIVKVKNNWWRVVEDARLTIFGGEIIIPKGFECDMASIPKCFQWFVPKRGKDIDVSIIHDYLYSEHSRYALNREEADIIFRELMKRNGMSEFKANLIFRTVRMFGENHYSAKKLCGIETVDRVALIDRTAKYKKHLEYVEKFFPRLIQFL